MEKVTSVVSGMSLFKREYLTCRCGWQRAEARYWTNGSVLVICLIVYGLIGCSVQALLIVQYQA